MAYSINALTSDCYDSAANGVTDYLKGIFKNAIKVN